MFLRWFRIAGLALGLIVGLLDLVPLVGATVAPKHLLVTFPKKLVKDAPTIPTDGELEASTEPVLYEHYGLQYQTGSNGERRLGRR